MHPSSERELVSLRYTLNSDSDSRLGPPAADADVVYELHVAPEVGNNRAGRLQPFIGQLERTLGQQVAVSFKASEPMTPLQVIGMYELDLGMPQMADRDPLSYRQALCTVIGIRQYLCERDETVEFFDAGAEHLSRTGGPCPLHPHERGWLEIDEHPGGRASWRCRHAAVEDSATEGDLIDLACGLDNLTPVGACATLLECYQLVPWIKESREERADRLWDALRADGFSAREQELRDRLLFPDLVDELIVQAQSSLPMGRTLTEKRRVDGFLQPVIELQELAASDPELLRYALTETAREDVCRRPTNRTWFHYPKAIIRNNLKTGAPKREEDAFIDLVRTHAAVERLLEQAGGEPASDEGRFHCPLHTDNNPSAVVTENGRWHCHSCGSGGDAIALAQRLFKQFGELSEIEAAVWLDKHFSLGLAESVRMRASAVEKALTLSAFWHRHIGTGGTQLTRAAKDLLGSYGLSPQTIAHFGLHADVGSQRLAIPLTANGELVGHDLRAVWTKHPCPECGTEVSAKRMSEQLSKKRSVVCPACGKPGIGLAWLGRQHPMYRAKVGDHVNRRSFVYNLDQAIRELDPAKAKALFVVEGYSDCWVAFEGGYRSVVATNGVMTEEKAAAIAAAVAKSESRDRDMPVVLVPDFDLVGLNNVERAITLLREANPEIEVWVADRCQAIWGGEDAPHDLGRAAVAFGVKRAVAPLEFASHWAVWTARRIVDPVGRPFDAGLLNQQKTGIVQLFGRMSASEQKAVVPALREILHEAWEPLMSPNTVDSWLSFVWSSASAEQEITLVGGTEAHSWIETYGSKVLKHGMKRGYDVSELYARERAAHEFGEDVLVIPPGLGISRQLKKRNHPTAEEIARELEVLESGMVDEREVRIAFYEPEARPVIVVHHWAGLFTLLVPIQPAATAAA